MTRHVVVRATAQAAVARVSRDIEGARPGHGVIWLDELRRILGRLSSGPESFACWRGDVRRALTRRFPYAVYFRIETEAVVVLAVPHLRRRPPSRLVR